MLMVPETGKGFPAMSREAVPDETGELARVAPDASSSFTVAAFDGLSVTVAFPLVVA
jgi:hypothetical protein